MPVLLLLEYIYLKVCTVGGGRCSLPLQPKPMLGSYYLRLRIGRICWVLVVNIGTYLINVCPGAYHPVDGKINEILPMDFPERDAIACRALASSVTFPEVLPNPPIASSPVRK